MWQFNGPRLYNINENLVNAVALNTVTIDAIFYFLYHWHTFNSLTYSSSPILFTWNNLNLYPNIEHPHHWSFANGIHWWLEAGRFPSTRANNAAKFLFNGVIVIYIFFFFHQVFPYRPTLQEVTMCFISFSNPPHNEYCHNVIPKNAPDDVSSDIATSVVCQNMFL